MRAPYIRVLPCPAFTSATIIAMERPAEIPPPMATLASVAAITDVDSCCSFITLTNLPQALGGVNSVCAKGSGLIRPLAFKVYHPVLSRPLGSSAKPVLVERPQPLAATALRSSAQRAPARPALRATKRGSRVPIASQVSRAASCERDRSCSRQNAGQQPLASTLRSC